MQIRRDAGPVKEVNIPGIVYVNLNRNEPGRLSLLFSSDEAREHAETLLRISDLKYSVEPDGSLLIENANQLLLSHRVKINGKDIEFLIGPPRRE